MKFLLLFTLLLPLLASAKKLELLDQHYGPDSKQVFDLWLPKKNKKAPLVIYIHGGGFAVGSKEDIRPHHSIIEKYNKAGIAFASINYRFLNQTALQNIMREDIAGFVQFMRYHSKEYKLNKKVFMSYGFSAGASASLWLGTHDDIADATSADPVKRESSRISAAGHLDGQVSYDYTVWYDFYGKEETDKFMGDQVWTRYHLKSYDDIYTEEGKKIRKDLDMYGNMTADDCPMLFWNNLDDHPTLDGNHFIHSPRHTRILGEKSKKLGLETEVMVSADGTGSKDPQQTVFDFFTKILSKLD